MDEKSFLERIRSNPEDAGLLREYAQWLTANGDPRGEYLAAELDLRETETQLQQLRSKVYALPRAGLDIAWLDRVLPLTVRSPTVGRFYAAPTPDEPPFVTVGDICYPDTTIGIIEVMMVFEAIPAGHTGIVSEVVASNGMPVDYGAPLLRLARAPWPWFDD